LYIALSSITISRFSGIRLRISPVIFSPALITKHAARSAISLSSGLSV